MILIVCLTGIPFTEDLSKTLPYSKAIGKKFVIKQDMYVYQYTDDDVCVLGSLDDLRGPNPDTPHVVDNKYIGKRAGNVIVKSVVREGQAIILSRVLIERGFESSYMRFRVLVVEDPYFSKHESDGTSLVNRNFNPSQNGALVRPADIQSGVSWAVPKRWYLVEIKKLQRCFACRKV